MREELDLSPLWRTPSKVERQVTDAFTWCIQAAIGMDTVLQPSLVKAQDSILPQK